MFATEDLSSLEKQDLQQFKSKPETTEPLDRLDGKIDKWALRNLYIAQSLHDRVQHGSGFRVKWSDLGSGTGAVQ